MGFLLEGWFVGLGLFGFFPNSPAPCQESDTDSQTHSLAQYKQNLKLFAAPTSQQAIGMRQKRNIKEKAIQYFQLL